MTTASITISERAAERIAQIVCNEPHNKMLRISVGGGGCSGFAYHFDLVAKAEPQDILIERAGAQGVISADERKRLQAAEAARDDVIQVDQFDPETYAGIRG